VDTKRLSIKLFVIIVTTLVSLILVYIWPLFGQFELIIYDFRLCLRGSKASNKLEKIVIIDIDERSLDELGRLGEWSRSYYAQVIDYLTQGEAKVIGFDIFFSEPSKFFPEGDQALAEATKRAKNVCHAIFFENRDRWKKSTIFKISEEEIEMRRKFAYEEDTESYPAGTPLSVMTKDEPLLEYRGYDTVLLPIKPIFKETNRIGYINIPSDSGFYRKTQVLTPRFGIYPSLAFQMACDYLEIKKEDVKIIRGKFIDMGKIKIPIDKKGMMFINYRVPSFYKISFCSVLNKEIPASFFKDKIVLIGGTAAGLFDEVATPINCSMPGVDVHANIIWSIIKNDFISSLEEHVVFVISFILSIIVGLISVFLRPLKGLIITLGLVIGYFIFAFCLFEFKGLYLDIVRPILSMFLIRFLFTERTLILLVRKND